MRSTRAHWALLALVTVGCGADEPRQIYLNAGAPCLTSGEGVLRAEMELTCLSSSCNTLVASACTISEADGTIKLTSRFVMERAGTAACTADCGDFGTACETSEPEPGSYEVRFGAARATLSFPLIAATRLLSDSTVESCEP